MPTTTTTWEIAAHTQVKHDLLRRYLQAWFPILSKSAGRVVFLDGFAGPGIYSGGEPGSPSIALNTLLDHGYSDKLSTTEFVFVFNEKHIDRYKSLSAVLKAEEEKRGKWPDNVKVVIANDDFSTVAEGILDGLGTNSLAPTFAFLDPFGYRDVPIDLIKRLMSFSKSELFVYLDINSLNRFATAGNVDNHFEALYGTDEFKKAPPAGAKGRQTYLRDLYERQLKDICGFKHVRSFEMVGPKNKAVYYLFFCTRSLLGFDKMKTVMWKAAPSGDFRFIDRLGGQPVLFEQEVDTSPLEKSLLSDFAGKTVSVDELEQYVIAETPYAMSHLRTKTLVPMQRAGKIKSPNQKRKCQFPSGTLVTFPSSRTKELASRARPVFS